MSQITNDKFVEFLNTFNDKEYRNNKFYDTITEISRKKTGKQDALIENDFRMYSLDDIAKGSEILSLNLPKTTDALFYKENPDGSLSLYFIEFKFHNLDDPDAEDLLYNLVDEIYTEPKKLKCVEKYKKDLNKIKQYYGDDVKHTLILKPIESIRVAIPKLYKEFDKDIDEKDVEIYLDGIEKNLYVFVSTYTEDGKYNRHKERMDSMSTGLEKHFERLISGNIIDNYAIHPRSYFGNFLESEILS